MRGDNGGRHRRWQQQAVRGSGGPAAAATPLPIGPGRRKPAGLTRWSARRGGPGDGEGWGQEWASAAGCHTAGRGQMAAPYCHPPPSPTPAAHTSRHHSNPPRRGEGGGGHQHERSTARTPGVVVEVALHTLLITGDLVPATLRRPCYALQVRDLTGSALSAR